MDKVGKEGVITVEESQTFRAGAGAHRGMRFDKGYISPYFVTDAERMEAELEDPYVLLVSSKISTVKDLLPLLEEGHAGAASRWPSIAEDVEGEAAGHPGGQQRSGAPSSPSPSRPRASVTAARRC